MGVMDLSGGPPATVLAAWDVREVEALSGGQGESFRAGPLVLKPVAEPERATWLAEGLEQLPQVEGLRIAQPVRSRLGGYVVDGWSAWRWLEGSHRPRSWEAVLELSGSLHAALADLRWSPRAEGSDRWCHADRVAWGETSAALPTAVGPLVARLRPVDLPRQVIHGDLGGNVLFHDQLSPAVIDVSPFWRPVEYADAIVVADALAWGDADESLAEALLQRQGDQLLSRAVLFRVAVDPTEVGAYGRVISLLSA